MAIAYRNSTGMASTSTGSIQNTYDSAVLSGSLLIALVSWDASGGATLSSVGDSVNGAASWSSAGAGVTNADSQRFEIYYKPNSSAGTPLVTATLSIAADFASIDLVEVTGAASSLPLDKYIGAVGTGSATPDSGTQTTTADGEYIFGALYHRSSETISNLNGFNARENNSEGVEILDKVQTTAGSISFGVTLSGSTATWTAIMATFKAAAASTITWLPVVQTVQGKSWVAVDSGFNPSIK